MIRKKNIDDIGSFTSFLCAIHCMVMPFIITALPIFGMSWLASEPAEWSLTIFTCITAMYALGIGYKQHGNKMIYIPIIMGVLLILLGRVMDHYNPYHNSFLLVLGGMCVMMGHLINKKLCNSCKKCHECHII